MTDATALVNLALQAFGSRTTVASTELAANSTNEAIQANLTFANTRDSLLRMAPWDCGIKTANLTYITSVPGTPENTSPATNLWQPGQPRPPWAYEYQYPNDCLRACWIIPASQTGNAGGIPITTAVTGSAPTTWLGGPISFKVGIDNFFSATTVNIVAPGTGYAIGDNITLALYTSPINVTNLLGTFLAGSPQGAATKISVATVDGSGGILTASIISQIIDSVPPFGGSLFYYGTTAVGQASTTGAGTGATFGYNNQLRTQRVILTNQQFATLVYVQQINDPNIWDPLFQDAFTNALGADLCMALSGDKALANGLRAYANHCIVEARKADGNEGLTVNDVTPDWIRIRGIDFDSQYLGPYSGFDWGGTIPLFT